MFHVVSGTVRRLLVLLTLGVALMAVLPVALISAALGAGVGSTGDQAAGAHGSQPPAPALPGSMLVLYRQAAATCPGLPWPVLAAVGTVESANGTSTAAGVVSGANSAGAEDIWMWDRALWDVRDGDSLVRASGVSTTCEAREGTDGGHTLSIRCLLRDGLSGLACGVSE